jgi:hypothetical protein
MSLCFSLSFRFSLISLTFSENVTHFFHYIPFVIYICNLFLKNCKMKTLIDLKTLTLRIKILWVVFTKYIYFYVFCIDARVRQTNKLNLIKSLKSFNGIDNDDCKTISWVIVSEGYSHRRIGVGGIFFNPFFSNPFQCSFFFVLQGIFFFKLIVVMLNSIQWKSCTIVWVFFIGYVLLLNNNQFQQLLSENNNSHYHIDVKINGINIEQRKKCGNNIIQSESIKRRRYFWIRDNFSDLLQSSLEGFSWRTLLVFIARRFIEISQKYQNVLKISK